MRLRRLALLAAAAVVLVAGCGGSGDSQGIASLEAATGDSTSTTAAGEAVDSEQAMLDYAQCMRDNGVDMEDPDFTTDAGGGMGAGGRLGFDMSQYDTSDPTFQAASEACQEIFGSSGLPGMMMGGGPGGQGGTPPEGGTFPDDLTPPGDGG